MALAIYNEHTDTVQSDILYVIQQGGDGPLKIGRTSNIKSRLTRLQTGNPNSLFVIMEAQNSGYHEPFWSGSSQMKILSKLSVSHTNQTSGYTAFAQFSAVT